MSSSVDVAIRKLNGNDARRKATHLWEKVHEMSAASQSIGKPMLHEVLSYSARALLYKLEQTGIAEERWLGFLSFFTSAMLSLGTHEAEKLLQICEEIFYIVLCYPDNPLDLFCEYLLCLSSQRHQRERRVDAASSDAARCPELENASADDVALVPEIPLSEVRRCLSVMPQRLTFPLQSGVVRLRLANPLPIPDVSAIRGGYTCDTCHINTIYVAYQAMLYDDGNAESVRSAARLGERSEALGFDMCVGCAVFFFRNACSRLSQALRDPFRTLRVSSAANLKLLSLVSKGDVVIVNVSVAPWGAQPIAWIAEEGVHLPPAAWRSGVRVTSHNRYVPSKATGGNPGDECAICMQPLDDGTAVLEMCCNHWFHVECIQEAQRMMADECPLCRRPGVFARFGGLALELNSYEVRISRPPETTRFVLVLGALLTLDGKYDNPTNIAACKSFLIEHPCNLFTQQQEECNTIDA
ncbi:hypothetical protein DQ04_01601060 [Trypanosoma grayi]|uniref:hypothetical protein n=1 Tax=Trypanosoma grayi TaxID=71804 RepID=UPI0004F483F5|nr:hypothetical protein DQ04_01601060 [Trypanosoma grayi]KEG12581.1 hypothetical protein DQ04_01601060 [Trypanosoma grayi]